MHDTLRLTEALIARPSITPNDAACLDLIAERLQALGFVCERLDRGPQGARVSNLWARLGHGHRPTLVWAGHTDVVPTGPLQAWDSDPFVPTHRQGRLYGRGASDMKTSLAAMVVACERFLAATPEPAIDLAFLLTSDEEGPAVDGTVAVCEILRARNERLDWCVVGEPTSVDRTGDMIKNGRRGTLSARLTVHGVQGHIAYPQLARNPIHLLAPALAELVSTEWDAGNDHFPPTSWQVSNIHGGTGASNVIPGSVMVDFNFRFSTESTAESLQARVVALLSRHGLREGTDFDLRWTLGGQPFLTAEGLLVDAARQAIRDETGLETTLSTTGGTSDGRFIAQLGLEVVELGPPNASIHQINEHVVVADMEPLTGIYRRLMTELDARTRLTLQAPGTAVNE